LFYLELKFNKSGLALIWNPQNRSRASIVSITNLLHFLIWINNIEIQEVAKYSKQKKKNDMQSNLLSHSSFVCLVRHVQFCGLALETEGNRESGVAFSFKSFFLSYVPMPTECQY
jgi:hypothetical protein